MSHKPLDVLLSELAARETLADEGGGRARQERHARLGRLNARERIALLVDADSFEELGRHVKSRHGDASVRLAANLHAGDGLVCGLATVAGRPIAVYAHDPTVLRGALGHEASKKLCRLLDLAHQRRFAVVALMDCEGVRVEEGTDAILSFGEVIRRTLQLRGRVPQLTLCCGLCVGGAAYTAVLTDCVGMIEHQSFMMVTGGKVTKVVTGESEDIDDLGPPKLHAEVTGSCHAVLPDERAGFEWLKKVMSFFTPHVPSSDPPGRSVDALETLIPTSQRRAYDMRRILKDVFDQDSVLELSAAFAPNLLTAFARLNGRAVAVVASQPMFLAGCLDVNASRKGAGFIQWAQSLGMPIVTLVDVPGYLPGKSQESQGILAHGATLLTAYADAKVPKVCLVVRKSYGGASVLSFAADYRLAFPTARINPMGAEASAEVVLGPSPPAEDAKASEAHATAREKWIEAHDSVWPSAEAGYIDRVIRPSQARAALCLAVDRLCAQEIFP